MTQAIDNAPATQDAAQAVDVNQVQLPEAAANPTKSPPGQIDILLDTTMVITARLGEAEIQIRELLQMGPGSVLKLDRQAGEPVDLFMRGTKFATGYLVVVGEQLGVRVKEILAPREAPKE